MSEPPAEGTRAEAAMQDILARASAQRAALEAERDTARAEVEVLRARLAEAERLADHDPLIPVLNRRAFVRELQRTAAFCARYGGPAALVYLDLDRFKAVNDRFGHAAGDAALTKLAELLVRNVRESDVVGRLGGDEFAIILAQVDEPTATLKAEALARRVGEDPMRIGGQPLILSVSTGVRVWEDGLEAAQWLAEADASMFVRKRRR